jgi:hypothetical protein
MRLFHNFTRIEPFRWIDREERISIRQVESVNSNQPHPRSGAKKNVEEENGMGEECRKVCAKTAALMETIEASMRF